MMIATGYKKQYILQGLPVTDVVCSQALFLDISGKKFHDLLLQCPFGRGLPPRNIYADNRCASALRKLLLEPLGYIPSTPNNHDLDNCYLRGWIHEAIVGTDQYENEIRGYIFPSPFYRWYV